jgi:hypothetical protein
VLQGAGKKRSTNASSHQMWVNPKVLQLNGTCLKIDLTKPNRPFIHFRDEGRLLGNRLRARSEAFALGLQLSL